MQNFTLANVLSFLKPKKAAVALLTALCVAQAGKAQDTCSASWTLLADQNAVVEGDATASPQTLGPLLAGISYNQNYGTTANGNLTGGWQRVATSSNIKTGSDSAFNFGGYVEYKVTPSPGKALKISTVSLEIVGGGTGSARVAVLYSLNNFATLDSFGITNYNGVARRATRRDSVVLINGGSSIPVLTGQQIIGYTGLNINVSPGQSFSMRVYVWLTGYSATIRHLGQRNIIVAGTTTTSLPVTFAGAKAFAVNKGIQVDWTTASEGNMDRFIVEHSADGSQFASAGSVAAKGSTGTAATYSWLHETPVKGTNYYRIKGIDKDGKAQYSGIIKVAAQKGKAELVIAPSVITGGILNLQINDFEQAKMQVNIVNSSGQVVYNNSFMYDGGAVTKHLQLPAALSKGMYRVQMFTGTSVVSKAIIIQ